jgi:hypothetical protein
VVGAIARDHCGRLTHQCSGRTELLSVGFQRPLPPLTFAVGLLKFLVWTAIAQLSVGN